MGTRERLAELLSKFGDECISIKRREIIGGTKVYDIAHYLASNGVILAEDVIIPWNWVSAKERLPNNDSDILIEDRAQYIVRLSSGAVRIALFGYKKYDVWVYPDELIARKGNHAEVTHWSLLRRLPEPPKEDE